jgi:hypothetical protein
LLFQKVDCKPEAASVQPQDAVVVDFVGYACDSKEKFVEAEQDGAVANDNDKNPTFHSAQDWLVIVGEKDVVPALELGIRFMNIGETALVWSHSKYGYGTLSRIRGDYALPAHSNVLYRVTVKSVVVESERDGPDFLMRYSMAKKEIGNDVYANEWDLHQGKAKAIQLYMRGARNLQLLASEGSSDTGASDNSNTDLARRAAALMADCLNNVVAVHLRAKDYHAAKQAAVKVLEVDPDNTKALLRAAKAALLDPASSYEEVKAALDAAAESPLLGEGESKELAKLRSQFYHQRQAYRERSKAFAANMMTKKDTSAINGAEARTSETDRKDDGASSAPVDVGQPVLTSTDDRLSEAAAPPADQAAESEDSASSSIRDWDVKTLLRFMFRQLLIVAVALAYTKWKTKPNIGEGRGGETIEF